MKTCYSRCLQRQNSGTHSFGHGIPVSFQYGLKKKHAAEGSQIFLSFVSVLIFYWALVRACARTHARTHFFHHVKAAVHNTPTAEKTIGFFKIISIISDHRNLVKLLKKKKDITHMIQPWRINCKSLQCCPGIRSEGTGDVRKTSPNSSPVTPDQKPSKGGWLLVSN